ncbi:MAG: LarC family nickel insertion protein [Candidatus Lokiarchaeota archaeon]|nr:LarC family nickel insertion protein [Candidatus Harpocratesius repetitus]
MNHGLDHMEQALIIKCSYAGISGDLFLSALAEIISYDKMQRFLDKIPSYIKEYSSLSIKIDRKISNGISGSHLLIKPSSENLEHHIQFDSNSIKLSIKSPSKSNLDITSPKTDNYIHQHVIHPKFLTPIWMKNKIDAICKGERLSSVAQSYIHYCFRAILEAEAKIHNLSPDQIHLHEIGAIDTIIDLIGVGYGLDLLGAFTSLNSFKIYADPIAVGGGQVKISHGIVSVPAPATLEILSNAELIFKYGPESRELATPTGVALLAGLKKFNLLSQQIPSQFFTVKHIGIGVGNIELVHQANILQILQVNMHKTAVSQEPLNEVWQYTIGTYKLSSQPRPISVIETNIDDVRGELLGNIYSSLLKAGALDVSLVSTITKKNRPGHQIQVLCSPENRDHLIAELLIQTGTLGVRFYNTIRVCLPRKIVKVTLKIFENEHQIPVKIALDDEKKIVHYKIEYDVLESIAAQYKISIIQLEDRIRSQVSLEKLSSLL